MQLTAEQGSKVAGSRAAGDGAREAGTCLSVRPRKRWAKELLTQQTREQARLIRRIDYAC